MHSHVRGRQTPASCNTRASPRLSLTLCHNARQHLGRPTQRGPQHLTPSHSVTHPPTLDTAVGSQPYRAAMDGVGVRDELVVVDD
eukprot:3525409-Rhodomonas_salina.2